MLSVCFLKNIDAIPINYKPKHPINTEINEGPISNSLVKIIIEFMLI